MTQRLILLLVLGAMRWSAAGATLTLTSQELHLYIDQGTPGFYSPSSVEYFTNLDGDNFGDYGWLITNNTANPWANISLLFFLDAEWDLGTNLVSNEYGEFLSLGLANGAPPGALAPQGWEIDEPGYVFGDIYTNVSFNGTLDNQNAVPSNMPDDVSLAFLWATTNLGPGDSLRLTILHQSAAVDGIGHFDPDSQAVFYVNGYLEVISNAAPGTGVPEPGMGWALGAGLAAILWVRRKGGK